MHATAEMLTKKTMKSTRLTFENNFSGPFITHGIDITPDPEQPDAIYILAVNHAPHPAYHPERPGREWHWEGPKARSQIELFHHVLDTTTVRHVRSIRHPLIRTPNDIYAESPSKFLVTNDHGYREGLRRMVEDTVPLAKWSDLVHVRLDALEATDAEAGVDATIALKGLYNNNGLGHGRSADEILIASAAGGIFWRAQPVFDDNGGGATKLSIIEEIRMESMLDNPSYYADPYATTPDDDASGFVLAGMRQPLDVVLKNQTDPTAKDGAIVWHMRPNTTISEDGTPTISGWETRLLFEDDGTYLRSGSTAVLVPIQTRPDEGKKAWLFVTGFYAKSVVAVKVDL